MKIKEGKEMKNVSLILILVIISLGRIGTITKAHAQVSPGSILVLDSGGGTSGPDASGRLFRVNPSTGSRTVISNFGNSNQGPVGVVPFDVAISASGNILVVDFAAGTDERGTLFKVNRSTGARTVVSDFGNANQGPLGDFLAGVAISGSGNILVTDAGAGTGGAGALFRVNPATGVRTVVSDFGNANQGPQGNFLGGLAISPSGDILVIDLDGGTVPNGEVFGSGALFRVNPTTGVRTVISDFGNANQGPLGEEPVSVVANSSGEILVIDLFAGTDDRGALFRVNPATGFRTTVSNFGNANQGPQGSLLSDLTPGASGSILVTDFEAGTNLRGALFRVNRSTGVRTVISSFGNANQGPLGANPSGVAVVPFSCNGQSATIVGTAGNNIINGTAGRDVIHGLGGNDTINGLGGNDLICGGPGNDIINGGIGSDRLIGGIGNDILRGNAGNDALLGEGGADTLDGGVGSDTCNGGLGSSDTAAGCESTGNVP